MIARCRNPKKKYYGGKGITVCTRWHDYMNFVEDMGPQQEGMSLDRIDNALGYCPENCRWVPYHEQYDNKTNNVLMTWKGETKTLTRWAEDPRITVKRMTLYSRKRQGWSDEDALTKPLQRAFDGNQWTVRKAA